MATYDEVSDSDMGRQMVLPGKGFVEKDVSGESVTSSLSVPSSGTDSKNASRTFDRFAMREAMKVSGGENPGSTAPSSAQLEGGKREDSPGPSVSAYDGAASSVLIPSFLEVQNLRKAKLV